MQSTDITVDFVPPRTAFDKLAVAILLLGIPLSVVLGSENTILMYGWMGMYLLLVVAYLMHMEPKILNKIKFFVPFLLMSGLQLFFGFVQGAIVTMLIGGLVIFANGDKVNRRPIG